MPTLARLHEAGKLPSLLAVRGIARQDWDTAAFRRDFREALEGRADDIDRPSRDPFVSSVENRRARVTDRGQVAEALKPVREPVVAYLALPPEVFLAARRVGERQALGLTSDPHHARLDARSQTP
jgi:glucose-6-phosphate 1-dehydrogenase